MKTKTLLAFLFVVVLSACAQGTAELKPPEIRLGEDVCADCNMIISDARFAASYAYEVGPGRYQNALFDDIGDMLVFAGKHPEHKVVAWYVHDYNTKEWVDATQATYVFSNELETPMASGTAAFATAEAAQKLAAELNGQVFDWNGLRAKHQAGELGARAAPAASGAQAGKGAPGTPAGTVSVARVAADMPAAGGAMHGRMGQGCCMHGQMMHGRTMHGQAGATAQGQPAASAASVEAAGMTATLSAPDGSQVLLTVVQPAALAKVGKQPIEIVASQKKGESAPSPVDDLALEITPEMPSMGHGSPGNVNPTSQGGGRYLGTVNFTMPGPWTVTLSAKRGNDALGQVVLEFSVVR